MTAHPLLLAITGIEALGCLVICLAGAGAVWVLLGWQPESASPVQLRLERLAERLTLMTRLGILFIATSTLLFIAAVAAILPEIVPGAMCGTGVLRNMGLAGNRVFYSRGVLFALLLIWRLLSRLDESTPVSRLTPTLTRLLILAAPAAVIAAVHLVQALHAIDIHTPVDCCATVYEAAAVAMSPVRSISATGLVWGTALLGIPLGAAAVALSLNPSRRRLTAATALLSVLFVPVAATALRFTFASYHYGVLAHYCPWCLFLPTHRLAGWPIYLSLFILLAEGPAVFITAAAAGRHPCLTAAATLRVKRGAVRLLLALILFSILTFGVALIWRLRFGVWMSG